MFSHAQRAILFIGRLKLPISTPPTIASTKPRFAFITSLRAGEMTKGFTPVGANHTIVIEGGKGSGDAHVG
jgi:hypothetical protein